MELFTVQNLITGVLLEHYDCPGRELAIWDIIEGMDDGNSIFESFMQDADALINFDNLYTLISYDVDEYVKDRLKRHGVVEYTDYVIDEWKSHTLVALSLRFNGGAI